MRWSPIVAAVALAAASTGAPAQSEADAEAAMKLVGSWVSVVSEDWHKRMRVPPRGEYGTVPMNAAARQAAGRFDPGADRAAGLECKAYGAPAIMTVPGHLRFQWTDDTALELDIDSGAQQRLLRFDAAGSESSGEPSWQGRSTASWSGSGQAAELVVRTTGMRAGYLLRNGVPYSNNAALEEHFDAFAEPNGDRWLVVTSILTDPTYLTKPYVTTSHFKKVAGNDGWDPTPCRIDQSR